MVDNGCKNLHRSYPSMDVSDLKYMENSNCIPDFNVLRCFFRIPYGYWYLFFRGSHSDSAVSYTPLLFAVTFIRKQFKKKGTNNGQTSSSS
jgi:hypothetical protein